MPDKLTTQQFAAKIKEKYPEYKDIDDFELTERITTKYPEYLEQVTVEKKSPVESATIQPDSSNGGEASVSDGLSTTNNKGFIEGSKGGLFAPAMQTAVTAQEKAALQQQEQPAQYKINGAAVTPEEMTQKLFQKDIINELQQGQISFDYPAEDIEMGELITKQAQSGGQIGDVWENIKAGTARLGAGVIGLKSYASNLLRLIPALKDVPKGIDEAVSEEAANKLIDYAKEEEGKVRAYEDGFINEVQQGNIGNATSIMFNTLGQSTPMMASIISTSGAGALPAIGLTGTAFASSEFADDETKKLDGKELTPQEKVLRATGYGFAESVFGQIPTGKILSKSFPIIKQGIKGFVGKALQAGGKEAAENVAKEAAKQSATMMAKGIGVDATKEIGGEVIAEWAQMGIDDCLGVADYTVEDYKERGAEAAALSLAMTGFMQSPQYFKLGKKLADENIKKTGGKNIVDKAKAKQEAGEITPQQLDVITLEVEKRNDAINAVPDEYVGETEVVDLVQQDQAVDEKIKNVNPAFIEELTVEKQNLEAAIKAKVEEAKQRNVALDDLAQRMVNGEKITSAEDLQLQANYPQELEGRLKETKPAEIKSESDKPLTDEKAETKEADKVLDEPIEPINDNKLVDDNKVGEKPKPKKKLSGALANRQKALNAEPQSLEQAIMQYFLNGGKISSSDSYLPFVKGSKEYEGAKSLMTDEPKSTSDLIAQRIINDVNVAKFDVDEMNVQNAIQQVLSSYSNKTEMLAGLKRAVSDAEFKQEFGMTREEYQRYSEQAELSEKQAKENEVDVEEYIEEVEGNIEAVELITEEELLKLTKEYDDEFNALSKEKQEEEINKTQFYDEQTESVEDAKPQINEKADSKKARAADKSESRKPEPAKEVDVKPIASATPQRVTFIHAGSKEEGTIIGKSEKGYDVIADDGTRYPVKDLDIEDVRDATPLEAAKGEAAIAKRNLKEQWNNWKQSQQNMGVIFDPESQAKQDVELMKNIGEYLRLQLKVGKYSFDKFITDMAELGVEITDAVKDKWKKFYGDTEKTAVKAAIKKEVGIKPKATEQKRINKAYAIGVADTKEVFKEKIAQLQSDFAEYSQYKKEQAQEKIAQLQAFKQNATDLIKSALDKDFISKRTFDSIMTKLGKAQTPNQYQKLFDYINKAAQQANYAEQLEAAKELQSKVRKKSKSDKNFADQKDISKAIARFDVTELDDLDAFIKIAESYVNSMLPVGSPKYQPFNVNEALTVLAELQNKLDASIIQKAEESTGFAGLTKEEVSAIIEALNVDNFDAYAQNLSDAKKKTLHDAARKQAEYAKIGLSEKIKEDGGFIDGFNERGGRYIETIKNADLTGAETKTLINYIRTADNIITNNSISNAGQLAQEINAIQNMPMLKKIAKAAKFFVLNKAQKAFESVPVMIKSIYGTSDATSKFRLYSGFDGVFTGGSKSNVQLEKAYKAWADYRKTNKIADTLADVQQRGVYAYLIQNYGGTDLDADADYQGNKAKVLQSIEAYRQSGDKDLINLAETLHSIYDADVAPFNTLTDFKNNFDAKYPKQVKAWQYFNGLFEGIKDDLRTVTEAYENESFEDVNNYSPISYTSIKAFIQEQIEGGMMFSERYPNKPKQTPTSIKRVKLNNIPDDMAVSFNFDSNMFRKYKRAVYDINTIDGRNLFRNVYNNKGFSSVVGGSKNAAALRDVYNSSEKLQAGAKAENDAAGEILRDITQGIRNIGTSFALGGFTQYLKQYPSVALKTLITLKGNAGLFAQVQKVPLDIPLLSEASIQERGARQGGVDLGETEKNVVVNATANTLNKYVKGFGDWTKAVRDLSLKSLQVGDTRVAKRSFMAHYMDYLLRKGIEVKASDLATEHNRLDDFRKEAISYAQQMIDEQQVPSNAALLAELQKYDGNAFKELFKNMFLPFNTFSGNVRGRIIEDIKFIKYGNQQQRSEAMLDLASNVAEVVAFQTISKFMLYAMIKYPASMLLGYLFDLEDDEKELDFWEQMNKQFDYWASQSLKDVFVGGLGGVAENLFVKGINYGAYMIDEGEDAKTMTFSEWSKKNSPVYQYPDRNKWYDQIGGYGVAFREYSEYLGNAKAAVDGVYEDEYSYKIYSQSDAKQQELVFNVKEFKQLSDDEQSFMIFVSMTNLFALGGLRDADIANMITAKKRQMLMDKKETTPPLPSSSTNPLQSQGVDVGR